MSLRVQDGIVQLNDLSTMETVMRVMQFHGEGDNLWWQVYDICTPLSVDPQSNAVNLVICKNSLLWPSENV